MALRMGKFRKNVLLSEPIGFLPEENTDAVDARQMVPNFR